MVRVTCLAIAGFLLTVCCSTADAQFYGGPFGGLQARSPMFRVPVPRMMPPFVPAPITVLPANTPPVFAVAPYRYGVRRIPIYAGPPNIQLNYSSPVGSGSIVINAPIDSSSRETFGRVPVQPQAVDTATALRQAASRLIRSLAYRRDGDIWIDYLKPNRIVAAIDQRNAGALTGLVNNYDGVAANPQLAWLTKLDGFAETRSLLAAYLELPALPQPEMTAEPKPILEPTADTGPSILAEPETPSPQTPTDATPNRNSPPPANPPTANPPADPVDELPLPVPNGNGPNGNGPTPAPAIKPASGPTSV